MSTIIHPSNYLIVEREATAWFFKPGDKVFYNATNKPVNLALESRLEKFGLTTETIMIEMFRINGGKAGYYLTNLRKKQYYYCGTEWQDVKLKLKEFGIGRDDPEF
ncbi:hypothetical protein MEO94_31305 [Dolichospermum sp. ST_sed9]|jgi:hypothetical protein|nr:hypothetical protein [Dolichospermum sp. ST_sed9]